MTDLSKIEKNYKKYIKDLGKWLPDGVSDVDIDLLKEMELLDLDPTTPKDDEAITRYFHVIESIEKITLISDDFVIWIVPDSTDGKPVTYTLVAVNKDKRGPILELAFATEGVYNHSALVLRILDKFLSEIIETQKLIKNYESAA